MECHSSNSPRKNGVTGLPVVEGNVYEFTALPEKSVLAIVFAVLDDNVPFIGTFNEMPKNSDLVNGCLAAELLFLGGIHRPILKSGNWNLQTQITIPEALALPDCLIAKIDFDTGRPELYFHNVVSDTFREVAESDFDTKTFPEILMANEAAVRFDTIARLVGIEPYPTVRQYLTSGMDPFLLSKNVHNEAKVRLETLGLLRSDINPR